MEYYIAQELADKLRLNVMTIYRWIKAKKLKAHKIGKEFRIDKNEFEWFLNSVKTNGAIQYLKNSSLLNNPKITIRWNKFLDPIFVAYVSTLPKPEGWTAPTEKEVVEGIKMYNEAWAEVGEKILTDIQKITGLSYERNVIDVHIVSVNPRPFSNPIVMKSRYPKDEFVSTLTEELIHYLFKDNLIFSVTDIFTKVKEKYPKSDRTVSHIIVFSVMEEAGISTSVGTDKEYIEALEIAKADKEWVLGLFK